MRGELTLADHTLVFVLSWKRRRESCSGMKRWQHGNRRCINTHIHARAYAGASR